MSYRMFFPPASEEDKVEAKDEEKEDASNGAEEADGEAAVPDLPDVPTEKPTEVGQPEAKKVKLDDSAEQK